MRIPVAPLKEITSLVVPAVKPPEDPRPAAMGQLAQGMQDLAKGVNMVDYAADVERVSTEMKELPAFKQDLLYKEGEGTFNQKGPDARNAVKAAKERWEAKGKQIEDRLSGRQRDIFDDRFSKQTEALFIDLDNFVQRELAIAGKEAFETSIYDAQQDAARAVEFGNPRGYFVARERIRQAVDEYAPMARWKEADKNRVIQQSAQSLHDKVLTTLVKQQRYPEAKEYVEMNSSAIGEEDPYQLNPDQRAMWQAEIDKQGKDDIEQKLYNSGWEAINVNARVPQFGNRVDPVAAQGYIDEIAKSDEHAARRLTERVNRELTLEAEKDRERIARLKLEMEETGSQYVNKTNQDYKDLDAQGRVAADKLALHTRSEQAVINRTAKNEFLALPVEQRAALHSSLDPLGVKKMWPDLDREGISVLNKAAYDAMMVVQKQQQMPFGQFMRFVDDIARSIRRQEGDTEADDWIIYMQSWWNANSVNGPPPRSLMNAEFDAKTKELDRGWLKSNKFAYELSAEEAKGLQPADKQTIKTTPGQIVKPQDFNSSLEAAKKKLEGTASGDPYKEMRAKVKPGYRLIMRNGVIMQLPSDAPLGPNDKAL